MNPLNFYRAGVTKSQYQKFMITLGIILLVSVLVEFVITPTIIKFITEYLNNFKPNHYLRKVHKNLPLKTKFYLWNVTNPDEVMKGEKPVMKDIGPYVFE